MPLSRFTPHPFAADGSIEAFGCTAVDLLCRMAKREQSRDRTVETATNSLNNRF